MREFMKKSALVTGGASGIGRAICKELARLGAAVVVGDINGEGADETARAITGSGGRAVAARLDVSDISSVEKAVALAVSEYGGLDYLFSSAAVCVTGECRDLEESEWRRVIEVNLIGAMNSAVAAYRVMASQGHGRIVNIASMAGFAPFSINAPYTASKFGIVGFTDALRHEAAGLGVGVTLVCPGIVRTEFYDAAVIKNADREAYNAFLPKRLLDAERAAGIIIRGVGQGRNMIVFPLHARLLRFVSKHAPFLITVMNRWLVKKFRVLREAHLGAGSGRI